MDSVVPTHEGPKEGPKQPRQSGRAPQQTGPLPVSESCGQFQVVISLRKKPLLNPDTWVQGSTTPCPSDSLCPPAGDWLARGGKISLVLFVKALSSPEINMEADADLRTKGYLLSLINVIKIKQHPS